MTTKSDIFRHQATCASTDSKYTREKSDFELAFLYTVTDRFRYLAQAFDRSCTKVQQDRRSEL